MLNKRGFQANAVPFAGARDLTPTNAIWICSPGISAEDVKLIAYTLIRYGILIRYIGPDPKPELLHGSRGRMVWIGGDQRYSSLNVKTVKEIQETPRF